MRQAAAPFAANLCRRAQPRQPRGLSGALVCLNLNVRRPARQRLRLRQKQQWGKLTDDELTQINGSQEKFEGIIQERYGIAKDEIRKQIDSWYQNQGLQ
jgi:uncharacterized protein YjbJ (UPF0337 family)